MGVKLGEIAEGAHITLYISNKDKNLQLEANIKKQIRSNVSLIDIGYTDNKRLVFDNVQIDVEYHPENDVPLVWHNAKIISYKDEYVLQVFTDGMRHNRRGSFRVAVATAAQLRMTGRGAQYVMIRDVSLSGFAIADRKKDLNLLIGDQLSVYFEDLGHKLDLDGRVVRIEEREEMIIYGFEITNLCKDLSSYISVRQRRNKN